MTVDDCEEALLDRLLQVAGDRDRTEISEPHIISYLQDLLLDKLDPKEAWEAISNNLRSRKVRNGFVVQWDIFRRVLRVVRVPTSVELQAAAELYEHSTPHDLEHKIRNLSGKEFERFVGAVLGRIPEFRSITLTSEGGDGGVDFRGQYVLPVGPKLALIGQAKRVSAPVGASTARDFIGAVDTCGEQQPFGLFVSTAGYTTQAITTFEKSRYTIVTWGMEEILHHAAGIATKRVNLTFSMPDDIFWSEIVVRA